MTIPMRLPAIDRRASVPVGVLFALLLASCLDATWARAVHHGSVGLVHIGVVLSWIGLSWYMLVLSAASAVAAVMAARTAADPRASRRAMRVAERAIFFFAVIAGSGIACQIIKHLVGRARPRFLEQYGPFHFAGPNVISGFDGFPSGHTTTMFAAATALSLLVPAWRRAFFLLAMIVGGARILAGAHFASDVVGGAVLGTVVAALITRSFVARGLLSLPAATGAAGGKCNNRWIER